MHMRKTMIITFMFVLLFIILAVGVQFTAIQQFDSTTMNNITEWREEGWTSFFQTLTKAGSTLTYAVIALIFSVYFAWKRNWVDLFLTFTSVLGAWAINSLLKEWFARERPDVVHLVEADGYSFPSSTAMISIALYGFLVYVLLLKLRNPISKVVILGVTGMLIVLIGFSRVYLGVHFPTDIIGGFFAGGFWLGVCIAIRKKMNPSTNK
ncbi:phosphatase PAP2 family protein [Fervidibacillus albus]|uniref:Phosphatase PAP2 family protein n=1 Tax=Fervidibacillus albus TaxID=2980026 RepID=A0A9E8LU46_9BACI|nr:phosphatase PAP2 family protein [Fervidibacillus albus]WAA09688.1 phosphatase PAP2 family protein [Fervidibacillus albus]